MLLFVSRQCCLLCQVDAIDSTGDGQLDSFDTAGDGIVDSKDTTGDGKMDAFDTTAGECRPPFST
jgi:hypothetical protein